MRTVAAARLAFIVSSCNISHFIRNPVRGGRPPRDRTVNKVKVVSHGAKLIMFLRSAKFEALRKWRATNTVPVIIK